MGLPGGDVGGVFENTQDSFQLATSNHMLMSLLIIQVFSAFAYNYAGMSVTGNFSAVFRTVLETMRTLGVWAVDLFLFYMHVGGLGEEWTKYSIIQAGGFAVLVAATLTYSRGDTKEAELSGFDADSYAKMSAVPSDAMTKRRTGRAMSLRSPMTISCASPTGKDLL